jgi:L-asparaginase
LTKKRVFIAYTGGTIGMRRTANGYAPACGYLQEQMVAMPELRRGEMPEFVIEEFEPLLDSSNMTPRNWIDVAEAIHRNYTQYDGFVVLHGTDTMAYTASALPFFLPGLRKPVIVTGSQIAMCEVRNDARQNLIAALLLAANSQIPEVCLCFGAALLRGCRAVKVHSDGLDAFDSPNYPPLGEIGIDIVLYPERFRSPPPKGAALRVAPLNQKAVGVMRLFPGISAQVARNMLQPPLEGLVIETYGAGNAPDNDPEFLAAIAEACERGVVIVNCTQCVRGAVHPDAYETGSALARAGVVPGHDMTVEAALAKLFFLLGCETSPEAVRRRMVEDLCGEMTPNPSRI